MTKATKKFVDLQMHSIYSDGYKTPTELAELLAKYNIAAASLTDHFSVLGIPEFRVAASKYGIKVIPGIELYVSYKRHHLHLLGYNFDIYNRELYSQLRKIQRGKYNLLKKITPKLRRKGIIVDPEILRSEKADYIGLNSLVRHIESNPDNVRVIQKALKKKKYEHWELYNKYFSKITNTYYPELNMQAELAIKLIIKAGGVAILAHPGQQLHFENDNIILELKKKGLRGIECFSPHHHYSQVVHYLRLAKQNNLLATGGSDYHGDLEEDLVISRHWDYCLLPYKIFENLKGFKK